MGIAQSGLAFELCIEANTASRLQPGYIPPETWTTSWWYPRPGLRFASSQKTLRNFGCSLLWFLCTEKCKCKGRRPVSECFWLEPALRHNFDAAFLRMAQDDSKFCYIALGSNMDDKLRHLSRAVQALKGLPGLSLRRTSSLYSTKAQYVSDQPAFLNAVVELELFDTRLSKIPELLIDLKQIEEELGRKPGIRRGPRVIDLDIIAVGRQTVNIQEGKYPLQVPHALMHERDFVLVPLNDLRPDWRHPALSGEPSVSELVERLKSGSGTSPDGASLDAWPVQMLPGAGGLYGKKVGQLWRRGEQTLIMGILNITPDSFSDGGDHLDPANAVRAAAEMVSAGAQILDIGGESTRPGAAEVSVEEEIRRVVPVIAGRHGVPYSLRVTASKNLVYASTKHNGKLLQPFFRLLPNGSCV